MCIRDRLKEDAINAEFKEEDIPNAPEEDVKTETIKMCIRDSYDGRQHSHRLNTPNSNQIFRGVKKE